ncbi:ABC transporter permease [Nocardia sp. NPDC051570]|uniref:ABC transporter permease n=1 Tax=Nocardia sp. NPDC051570 TaxID=3364324 RepID=UPI00379498D3
MTLTATIRPTANVLISTFILTGRLLVNSIRNPVGSLTNLIIAAFFFVIYLGGLGGSANFSMLGGGNYATFLLPTAVVFASAGGSSTGLLLVEDIQSGYLRRILAMPVSRFAAIAAPVLVGGVQVLLQVAAIVVIGFVVGAGSATGFIGIITMVAIAFVWGMFLAAISAAVALTTGNAQATQSATLLLFPLIFMSPAFVPRADLQTWLRYIASANPTTYVLEGMRSVLLPHGGVGHVVTAFTVSGGLLLLAIWWATSSARSVVGGSRGGKG